MFIITLITIIAGAQLAWVVLTPTVRSGKEIKVTINSFKTFTVTTPVIPHIEVAGANLFLIYNGEATLTGKRTLKPLGWDHDYYYTDQMEDAPGGQWNVFQGDGEIRLTSEMPMTVSVDFKDEAKIFLIFFDICAILAVFIIMIKTTTPK